MENITNNGEDGPTVPVDLAPEDSVSQPEKIPAETADGERITRLIVSKVAEDRQINLTDGGHFSTKRIFMQRGDTPKVMSYYNLHNLKNAKALEVMMYDLDEGFQSVDLPTDVLDKIAEYIRTEQEHPDEFNCYAFINYINGLGPQTYLDHADWKFVPLEGSAPPGENIVVASDLGEGFEMKHAAISVGHDLFLSQLGLKGNAAVAAAKNQGKDAEGGTGRLVVMSLPEMFSCYGASSAAKIVPRKEN